MNKAGYDGAYLTPQFLRAGRPTLVTEHIRNQPGIQESLSQKGKVYQNRARGEFGMCTRELRHL